MAPESPVPDSGTVKSSERRQQGAEGLRQELLRQQMDRKKLEAEDAKRQQAAREQLYADKFAVLFQERKKFMEDAANGPKKPDAKLSPLQQKSAEEQARHDARKNSVAETMLAKREQDFLADIVKEEAAKLGKAAEGVDPTEFVSRIMQTPDSPIYRSALSVFKNQGDPKHALGLIRAEMPKRLIEMTDFIKRSRKREGGGDVPPLVQAQPESRTAASGARPRAGSESKAYRPTQPNVPAGQLKSKVVRRTLPEPPPDPQDEEPGVIKKFFSGLFGRDE